MGTWYNNDGLYIKYGQDEGTPTKGGEYRTNALERMEEVFVTLTDVGATQYILADTTIVPKNARLSRIRIINETAATSGGSAVLNIGLVRTDRTTVYDADGLVAAIPIASINAAGETVEITPGGTNGGALLGTSLANPALLVADYDTAAFTAGVIRIQVYYYFPTVP